MFLFSGTFAGFKRVVNSSFARHLQVPPFTGTVMA